MKGVQLSGEALSEAFPFSFALDRALRLVSWGRSLPKLVKTPQGAHFDDHFALVQPPPPARFEALAGYRGLVRLEVKASRLRLRGQFVPLGEDGMVLFIGSPLLKDLGEVKGLGLTFDDFAVHDAVPDLLFLLQAAESARQQASALAQQLDASMRLQREATEKAEASSRAKGDFLAAFSHEIRTPLNAVVGLTQLALEGGLDVETRDYLDRVHANATILLGLLNNVLDLSKIEAKQMELNDVSFDLCDLVESAVEAQSGRLSGEELSLSLSLDSALPDFVRGDQVRLGQILTNLIGNALKFTAQGEVHVSARLVRMEASRVLVRFMVRDTGIGIALKDQQRIFERFFQVKGDGQQVARGSGLGLNITAALVELMGGTMSVESELGHGSAFSVDLPFARESSVSRSASTLTARVTLVAEPSPPRDELCRGLSGDGLELQAVDSLAALAQQAPAQLTVLDGALLRRDEAPLLPRGVTPSRTLVLLASGQKLPDALAGAATLHKPIGPRRLMAALQRLGNARGDDAWRRSSIAAVVPLRILFVDDNADNRFLGERLLRHTRCSVDFANDGAAALALATTRDYDLVLLDVEMPLMNGFEMAAALRRHEEQHGRKRVPIVAVTAHALEGFRQRCLDAGMDDYLTKPMGREAFYSVLEKYGAVIASSFTPPPTAASRPESFELEVSMPPSPAPAAGEERPLPAVAQVDPELLELVPQFLSNCRRQVGEARQALATGNLTLPKRTGHNFKGIGVSYGFDPISAFGAELEQAAKAGDAVAVTRQLDALDHYLSVVKFEAGRSGL